MVVWDRALETGDNRIDNQHKGLFALIDELHDACLEGTTDECVDAILQRLMGYTVSHFTAEESLMARSGYPAHLTVAHKAAHRDLRADVDRMLQQRVRGELTSVLPLIRFLNEWLKTHIRVVDREFVAYVQRA